MLNSFQEGVLDHLLCQRDRSSGNVSADRIYPAVFLWKRRIYVNRGLCGGDLQRSVPFARLYFP